MFQWYQHTNAVNSRHITDVSCFNQRARKNQVKQSSHRIHIHTHIHVLLTTEESSKSYSGRKRSFLQTDSLKTCKRGDINKGNLSTCHRKSQFKVDGYGWVSKLITPHNTRKQSSNPDDNCVTGSLTTALREVNLYLSCPSAPASRRRLATGDLWLTRIPRCRLVDDSPTGPSLTHSLATNTDAGIPPRSFNRTSCLWYVCSPFRTLASISVGMVPYIYITPSSFSTWATVSELVTLGVPTSRPSAQ